MRPREGGAPKHSLRMEMNASATTNRGKCAHVHSEQGAERIRPQKAQNRNEAGVRRRICPTSAVPPGRRCSTCPEGGDATYFQRKEVKLVSK